MKRTIADARRAYDEEVAPHVSDYWAVRFKAVLEAAEARAKLHADEFAAEREQEVLALRDASLRELTDVRDGYDDLLAAGAEGRIPAREYAAQLGALHTRQADAEAELSKAAVLVEGIEAIESDPVAWFDDLIERTPHIRSEWPW